MSAKTMNVMREVLACLICSKLYFELRPRERLALVKSLTAELSGGTDQVRGA